MAKYICEFGSVISAGQKIIEAAGDLTNAANTYSSRIESDLAGWNGEAKGNFTSTCTSQVQATLAKAQEISAFGEFVVKAAQSIQQLDDQLASLSI